MANNTNQTPWYADATGTLTTERVYVKSFYFFGAAAGGALDMYTDSTEAVPVWFVDTGVNGHALVEDVGWLDGLYIKTITAGELYIYMGDGDGT